MALDLLQTLRKLTQDEQNVLKTFEKRIYAIYPLKKHSEQIVQYLDLCKKDPSAKHAVHEVLNQIKTDVAAAFANLDFTAFGEEKALLDAFAQQKKLLYEDLFRELQLGEEKASQALNKVARILSQKQEELEAVHKAETALDHFKEVITLFQKMIVHQRELASKLDNLVKETETFQTNGDIDHLMLEWRTLSSEIETAVKQEKVHVFDHLQPLLQEKAWAEQIVEKYEKMPKKWFGLKATKITRQDLEKDSATLVEPAEFQAYQAALLKYTDILTPDARAFLQEEGKRRAEAQRMELKRLTTLATFDHLTRLYNPHTFKEICEKIMAERDLKPVTFLFIDIDDFGPFNKLYGEKVGDGVLAGVAAIIKKHIRKGDIAARWGGEELCVFAPETIRQGGETLAENLRIAIEKESVEIARSLSIPPKPITVSIGVSFYDPQNAAQNDGTTFVQLFDVADRRSQLAKRAGKNTVAVTG